MVQTTLAEPGGKSWPKHISIGPQEAAFGWGAVSFLGLLLRLSVRPGRFLLGLGHHLILLRRAPCRVRINSRSNSVRPPI